MPLLIHFINLLTPPIVHHNLSPPERKALEALTDNAELVISKLMRRGGIVAFNRSNYVAEAHRLLSLGLSLITDYGQD